MNSVLENRGRELAQLLNAKLELVDATRLATAECNLFDMNGHDRVSISMSTPVFCLDVVDDSSQVVERWLERDAIGGRHINDWANQFVAIDSAVNQFLREQAWVSLNNYLVLNNNVIHDIPVEQNTIGVYIKYYTSGFQNHTIGTIEVPFGDTLFGSDWMNLPQAYLCNIKGLDLAHETLSTNAINLRGHISLKLRQTPIYNLVRGAMNAVWATNPKKL